MQLKKPWLTQFVKDWRHKKVLILGLGLLGRGVQDALFFSQIGAQVTVSDLKTELELRPSLKHLRQYPIEFTLGKHSQKDIMAADLILRNAAVPFNSPFLQLAREKNIRIEMDEALFSQYAPVKLIGITGTRGKSTTTSLIYQILKQANLPTWLGGNTQGKATLPLLAKVRQNDWLVLELSSWQLQGFDQAKISPQISVVTNIYQDHLNRYLSMTNYINDKKIIFKYQTKENFLVLNKQDPVVKKFAPKAKSKIVWFSQAQNLKGKIKLQGKHNLQNIDAALKVAQILKIKKQIALKAVSNFLPLAHRLEKVALIKGVAYINDSTSTTPAATLAALSSFQKPIILIAGGATKNLDLVPLAQAIVAKVKQVIFLQGTATEKLISLVKKFKGEAKIAGQFDNFILALTEAEKLAGSDEIVLLSPGCASFGMFKNEFDRGEQFKKWVRSRRWRSG